MIHRFLSWPIHIHLVILIALLAAPSISLIVYSGIVERHEAIADAKAECLKFVNNVATQQQAIVAGAQQLATALALLPPVQSRNPAATTTIFSDLLGKNPQYSNIAICDKSGLVWASAVPLKGRVSMADRRLFRETVRTQAFSSGEYLISRITNKPVLSFGYPLKSATNEPVGVIGVVLNLDYMQRVFDKLNLPPQSSFSLLDHQGIILMRSLQDEFSEKLVGGRDTSQEIFTRMEEGPDEGTYEAMGNDGRFRLVAYKKIALPHESKPYLYIRSSTPMVSATSRANIAMFRNLSIFASFFLIGLVLAWFLGKRVVVNPIMLLKKASEQLASGADAVNVSHVVKNGELGELARTFDAMAHALLQRESALRKGEEQFRLAASAGRAMVYDLDVRTMRINALHGLTILLGRNAVETELTFEWYDLIHPEDLEIYHVALQRMCTNPRDHVIEYRLCLEDGRILFVEDHATPVTDDVGQLVRIVGTLADITEHKRAEEALKESEEKYRAAFMTSPDSININTMDGRYVDINEGFTRMSGFTQEDVIGVLSSQLGIWSITDDRAGLITGLRDTGAGDNLESVFRCKDGSLKTCLMSARIIKINNEPHILSITHDITERKQMEEALNAQVLFLQNLIDTIPNAVFFKDRNGVYQGCNGAFEEYTGLSRQEIVGESLSGVYPDELAKIYTPEDSELFARPGTQTYESVIQHSSGVRRDVIITRATYDDSEGNGAGLIGVMVDITERKDVEKEVSESEKKYRSLYENATLGIFHSTFDGRFIDVNPELARMLGYESPEEVLRSIYNIAEQVYVEPQKRNDVVLATLARGEIAVYENRYRRKNGEEWPAYLHLQVIRDEHGEPLSLEGFVEDITARKMAEDQIRSSLHEKEILLKEIHHRVKNNLQVISSLLNLQSHRLHDHRDVDIFRTSMDRVKSMALIHDKLYRSENLARVYFPEYANDLVRDIFFNYSVGNRVGLDLGIDPVSFDIDTAVPLGLVINELVSNALKHAFPEDRQGNISTRLHIQGKDAVLVISDDGIGFPEDVDYTDTPSLGMQLVVTLVEQLEGAIELNRNGGTEFRITFKAEG